MCKWVQNARSDAYGIAGQYKANILVCRNRDDEELGNIFAPAMDFSVDRLLLSIGAQKNSKVHQVDFRNAFLHCTLNRKVYVTMADLIKEWWVSEAFKEKSLYRLKESNWKWYKLLYKSFKEKWMNPILSSAWVFKANIYIDPSLFWWFANDGKKRGQYQVRIEVGFETSTKWYWKTTQLLENEDCTELSINKSGLEEVC